MRTQTNDLKHPGGRSRAPILHLVPKHSPNAAHATETARALREMADIAERGGIVGVAYVAIRPGNLVAIGRVGNAREELPLVSFWLQKLNNILLGG